MYTKLFRNLLVVFVVGLSLTIVVLAMLGPIIGNVFSNIFSNLGGDGGGGVYVYNPPSQQRGVVPNTAPQNPTPFATIQSPQISPPNDMFFEEYGVNPFIDTEDDHLSTFAMDVDTASYTLARNYLLNQRLLPPKEAIRVEEFVNYFNAGYDSPTDDAFGIVLDVAPAPFGYEGHYVLRVGVQARYIPPFARDPQLLIFVIDISGSMDGENRLGLVKKSLGLLLSQLREDDRVAIVVYSNNSRVLLSPTPVSDRVSIQMMIDSIRSEGSTNAEAGLRLGYDLALANRLEGEATRIILLSDGVANVGNTGPDAILNTIKSGVESGITLSTIGFGMGNYNDVLMEQLANDGDGNYYYVDTLREAERVFVYNLTGTLQVVGYDAKIQVDFNPEVTDRYRLLGYENRAIADDDFRNDAVDAGEVGAGHHVTALYELALEKEVLEGTIATVYIRYEDAETRQVMERRQDITVADILSSMNEAPIMFKIQVAVAEFAELLRGSFWAKEGSYAQVLAMLEIARAELPEDRTLEELVLMVRTAMNAPQP